VSDTLDALRKLDLLLRGADLNALQMFAELRGSLQGLPVGFEDALDEALQNLDLEAAHALCSKALQSVDGLDIK
jgi:hypothetical protein